MKKIIFVNILFLILIFMVSELFLWNKFFKNDRGFFPEYSYRDNSKLFDFSRIETGTQFHRKPVLLLGCSYTYGHGLSKDENFSGMLSKATKRPVYNWAYLGEGPLQNLLRVREPANKKYITKGNPEYVIYTYMFDQTLRMSYMQDSLPYFTRLLYYARKDGLIPQQKFIPFIDRFYTVQYIRDKFWNDYLFTNQSFDDINVFFDYLKFVFKTMKSEVDKAFPGAKFIILLYDENLDDVYELHRNFYDKLFSSPRWKELEEYGITTVSTKELVGFTMTRDYMLKNDFIEHPHPSKEAWEIIVPKFVERFNL